MPIPRIVLPKPRILPETLPKGAPVVGDYPKRTPYFSGKTPGHRAYIPGEESSGQTLLFPSTAFKSYSRPAPARALEPPFKPSGPRSGGSPKKKAKESARKAELRAKAAAKRAQNKRDDEMQGRFTSGALTPAPRSSQYAAGPKTKSEMEVDAFFGAEDIPMLSPVRRINRR